MLQTGSNLQDRLRKGIASEEIAGLKLVLYARFSVLFVLFVWAIISSRSEYAIVYAAILALFGLLGTIPLILDRYGYEIRRKILVFFTIDVALITYVLMVPGTMFPSTLTPQFNLQLPGFLYLCLFVVGMAVSYSPLLVLWTGIVAIFCWSVGMLWIIGLPESIVYSLAELLDPTRFTDEERVAITSSRLFVSITHWYNRILFLALVTMLLTLAVWRSRRLVARQIQSESARANLARYFSPDIVDQISRSDANLQEIENKEIAVLFVDIVGFTELSERLGPNGTIELLREFHSRLGRLVFEHKGTIDKYIGDALMANFGSPVTRKDDATNALRCAFAIIDEISSWNEIRARTAQDPVSIGIGIHFGEVVTGNIGNDRHLEYAVLGDTVNLASRLERLTRNFHTQLVVSGDLVEKAKAEGVGAEELLVNFQNEADATVRGRKKGITVWRLVQS